MQKSSRIFVFLCFFHLQASPQYDHVHKIDSLKKQLYSLQDTARVDCLNELSYQYILSEKKDSAKHYAAAAFDESKKQNYGHGMAISRLREAHIAKHFDDDFITSEAFCKQSLGWYQKTANKAGIADVYYYLIYSLLAQSKFDEGIHYANEKYAFAKKISDRLGMIDALAWLHSLYRTSGDYEKSFLYVQQIYEIAIRIKNKIWISSALYGMAQLYELIEDYPSALTYFRRVLEMDDDETRKERIQTDNDIWFKMEFTEAFSHLGQFDSAWHYYHLYRPAKDKAIYMRVWWVSTGECYFLQKEYGNALQNFQLGLAEHKKLNDHNEIMRTLLDMGKTYLALNDNKQAVKFGREGLNMALKAKSKQFIRDGYQIFSTVYDRLQQTDSANFYFREYTTMKEEVLDDQAKAKFAAYDYEQKIALVNKQRQIVEQELEIRQQRLQKQSLQKKFLLIGIVSLFLIGGFVVLSIILRRKNERQRLEHEMEMQRLDSDKTKAELQQQAAELEMQALRAQMNPHFIFNSLNSINMFILENNKLQASEYLSKFSKLIRLILQNSQEALIPLEKELEALQLYLELESLRFDQKFEYNILIDEDIDTAMLKVPPLFIQPFVENAIWHGLMHKKERGHLEIELYQKDEILVSKITDDGIGRSKAAELRSKSASMSKSLGMRITADRIAMLEQQKYNGASISVIDLTLPDGSPGGTEVLIKIPVHHD